MKCRLLQLMFAAAALLMLAMDLRVFGVSFRDHAIYFKILVLQGFEKKILAFIISQKSLKM